MKRAISTALACLLLVSTFLLLASCGVPNGTYTIDGVEDGPEYKFFGSKVTVTTTQDDETMKQVYKYEITEEDGKEVIKLTFVKLTFDGDSMTEEEVAEYEEMLLEDPEQTLSFEKGDGYIVINGMKLVKQ